PADRGSLSWHAAPGAGVQAVDLGFLGRDGGGRGAAVVGLDRGVHPAGAAPGADSSRCPGPELVPLEQPGGRAGSTAGAAGDGPHHLRPEHRVQAGRVLRRGADLLHAVLLGLLHPAGRGAPGPRSAGRGLPALLVRQRDAAGAGGPAPVDPVGGAVGVQRRLAGRRRGADRGADAPRRRPRHADAVLSRRCFPSRLEYPGGAPEGPGSLNLSEVDAACWRQNSSPRRCRYWYSAGRPLIVNLAGTGPPVGSLWPTAPSAPERPTDGDAL